MVLSSENYNLERDLSSLYPGKFRFYYMKYRPGHGMRKDEMDLMYAELSKAKRELETADAIFYARSYGAFTERQIKIMKDFFSKPVVIATEAIVRRLKELKAKRVYLVSPYNQWRHDYEVKWLRQMGFEVVGSIALGRTGGKAIASTPPEMVINAVRVAHMSCSDAVYVACTILSTLPILDKLSGRLPVVTAASAMIEVAAEDGLLRGVTHADQRVPGRVP